VKLVATAPRYEINLHRRLPESLVQIQLVGLNGHFGDVFQAWRYRRLRVTAEFHTRGTTDHSVDVVALVDGRQSVPGTVVARR
jgi:hypothetical protein